MWEHMTTTQTDRALRVFADPDEDEFYVAVDEADLKVAWEEMCGSGFDEAYGEWRWRKLDPNEPLTINMADDDAPPKRVTKTAAEWAAEQGRGFLAGRE